MSVPARFAYILLWGLSGKPVELLCEKTGYGRHAVRAHCEELRKAGWVAIERRGRRKVIHAVIPTRVQQRMATDFRNHLETCAYAGETTARAWAELLVAECRFVDNFRPDFLRNPKTGHAMEYDMFEPERLLAIEYNGAQHYRPTPMFSDEREFEDQRARDLMKQGLSLEQGVMLIVVRPKDLTLPGMLAKFEGLPLRRYDASGPCVKTLEEIGQKLIQADERLNRKARTGERQTGQR